MTGTNRYECPLNCGWHHDQPDINPTNPSALTADIHAPEDIHTIVSQLMATERANVEPVIRAHLETHELLEWVQAVSRLRSALAIAETEIATYRHADAE